MFVQVLIEEKKRRRKGKECSSQEIYMVLFLSFFLSGAYDRYKIVEGNEEKIVQKTHGFCLFS